MVKKLYIIAGEASGDLHASNLIKAIQTKDGTIDFQFWGGDRMKSVAKKEPVKHIKELAFMGFIEVILNLRTILKNIKFCKQNILEYQPDALVLIDYPGFNLRIAEWAKKQGITVYYYISPQVWAWKQKRVHTIKKVVDRMFVILPFEKDFYAQFDMQVDYVGHPLMDVILPIKSKENELAIRKKLALSQKPLIVILPGSRKQEIQIKLPIMLKGVQSFKNHEVVVAGAPSMDYYFYEPFLRNYSNVKWIDNATYELLSIAEGAVVTSGTATLETALFEVPQVVCYKGSFISYWIAKRLVKIKYISLVNLILDKEAVKELIQKECKPKNIEKELLKVLPSGENHQQLNTNYKKLITLLGVGGTSKKVADGILSQKEK